jgi:hypothetical protein
MKIDEHFNNKIAATVVIRDFSEKIFGISKELKSADDVRKFKDTLLTLRSMSNSNIKEIDKLLSE